MIGDATLFQRSDSVMAGWQIVKPIQDYWASGANAALEEYAAGSDGPKAADELLEKSGRAWRDLD
jgi:glucose-6-phosphate 1-dehydrogenase